MWAALWIPINWCLSWCVVEWPPLNGRSMTAACVWSNGAWSRLCLWILDGGCGLSHLPPRGEDSSMHAWCWKLYGSRGEVQAVHVLCRRVLSKRKVLLKMVRATHGKSHPNHASVYFCRAVRDPLWIKIWCAMKTQSGSPLLYIDGAAAKSPFENAWVTSIWRVRESCPMWRLVFQSLILTRKLVFNFLLKVVFYFIYITIKKNINKLLKKN